jgi:Ca2+-transporting ATPase
VNTGSDPIWSREGSQVVADLDSSSDNGLSERAVLDRRARTGPNVLATVDPIRPWKILVEQFKSIVILLLVAAAVVSAIMQETPEAVAIIIVIALNTIIGFVTELKARQSMEALRQLGTVLTRVRRDGAVSMISSEELVPGDMVLVEAGDVITADLRILHAANVQCDESLLTGESLPVGKHAEPVAADAFIGKRRCMLYRGTSLTRGYVEAIVVATGMQTEIGRIAQLAEEAEAGSTPLEQRLDALARKLVWLTLGVVASTSLAGILAGRDIKLMIETGIALAVAAIPEGLPIVATIALARGLWRMAARNALINRLSAVETLGATDVICSDKTGTLTENRMSVSHLATTSGDHTVVSPELDDSVKSLLEIGVLCNNASIESGTPTGDPLERALLEAGRAAGLERSAALKASPLLREEAFDPDRRMMATVHRDSSLRAAVKGAPEAVLAQCTAVRTIDGDIPMTHEERERWLAINEDLASRGLRILAGAEGSPDHAEDDPYRELTFVGLYGLLDPPRLDVRDAIEACNRAGIRVVMITGDYPATARSIGEQVGLYSGDAPVITGDTIPEDPEQFDACRVFARISPDRKLELIDRYQEAGHVVAMIGDGVNDAPALRKADIGIAMGKHGTQVAREAAEMVLVDDAFSSIIAAIEQGRVIFRNIRKFVFYLLSCNISEIMVVALASIMQTPLPILPLQILFLNLVTDVFPALALGVGEGAENIIDRPPRDSGEEILMPRHWLGILGYGMIITLAVLSAFAIGLAQGPPERAVTIAFLTLALAQLWHVFNMRAFGSPLLRNDVTTNPFVWGALLLCIVLLAVSVYVTPIARVLQLTPPGSDGWALAVGMSLLPVIAGVFFHRYSSRRNSHA